MFKVWYLNFQTFSLEEFDNVNDAIEYGKRKGFDFCIVDSANDNDWVYSWCPFRGGRWFTEQEA